MPRPKKKDGTLFLRKNNIREAPPDIPKENILSLRKKIWEIKIDPQAIKNFLRIHQHPIFIIAGVFFVMIIISVSFHTKASVATFYPSSCLGGWSNVSGAEGEPEVTDIDKLEDFNEKNSALLKDSTAEIFCGGFTGEVPNDATPKRFSVVLTWSVDDGAVDHNTPAPFEIPTTNSSSEIIIEPEQVVPETEIPLQEIAPNPESTEIIIEEGPDIPFESTPSPVIEQEIAPSSEGAVNWYFIKTALAQEETLPEVVVESVAETPNLESGTVLQEEIKIETVEIDAVQVETNTEEVIDEENPSDVFMELNYTLDGKEWKTLSQISKSDWQKGEFDIVDSKLETWEDLSLLQLQLKPISSIDSQPVVYLDAISLNVEYSSAVDDVLPQPDFLNDEIFIDKTVDNIRVIKLRRDGVSMVWYTNIDTNTEVEIEEENQEQVDKEPEVEIPQNPTEPNPVVEEDVSAFRLFKTAYAEESVAEVAPPAPPEPTPEPIAEEIPAEPVSDEVEVKEIKDEQSELNENISGTKEEVKPEITLPIENIFPAITPLETEIIEEIKIEETSGAIKYTQSDIQKERGKHLEWTFVASGDMVDNGTTVEISGGKIFWFSKDKNALYEYNTASGGVSSQTVDITEDSSVIYLEPNGDESILQIKKDTAEIITPVEVEEAASLQMQIPKIEDEPIDIDTGKQTPDDQ